MRKIGYSHGSTWKLGDPYLEKNIDLFKKCGCNAIEVNCHSIEELEKLDSIMNSIEDFNYKSVHFPCNLQYRNNDITNLALKKIGDFYNKIGASLAVVHPDLVEDWSVFKKYDSINWAVENMDDRNTTHRDAKDMKKFFDGHKNWSFVLDVGHCNANDKNMKLAEDLIAEFKNKIKEIHLSGYEIFHEPLHHTKQIEIIKCCKKLDVPIIIESTFEKSDGEEGVKKEFDYIVENLK
jgi:hypothetical protein